MLIRSSSKYITETGSGGILIKPTTSTQIHYAKHIIAIVNRQGKEQSSVLNHFSILSRSGVRAILTGTTNMHDTKVFTVLLMLFVWGYCIKLAVCNREEFVPDHFRVDVFACVAALIIVVAAVLKFSFKVINYYG